MKPLSSMESLLAKLRRQGFSDTVLAAMSRVDRAQFVDGDLLAFAYQDRPLAIDCQQSISQPSIVAKMTALLLNQRHRLTKVAEIGTGSGYQAAVLAGLATEVWSIERIEALYRLASQRLSAYPNVHLRLTDDIIELKPYAPFDGLMITACCREIKAPWLDLLAQGGCLVLPLADGTHQFLTRLIRDQDHFILQRYEEVRFVPWQTGLLHC